MCKSDNVVSSKSSWGMRIITFLVLIFNILALFCEQGYIVWCFYFIILPVIFYTFSYANTRKIKVNKNCLVENFYVGLFALKIYKNKRSINYNNINSIFGAGGGLFMPYMVVVDASRGDQIYLSSISEFDKVVKEFLSRVSPVIVSDELKNEYDIP